MTICAFFAPFAGLSKLPKNAEIVGMTRGGVMYILHTRCQMLCSKKSKREEIRQRMPLRVNSDWG